MHFQIVVIITHTTSSDEVSPHVANAASEGVSVIAIGTSSDVSQVNKPILLILIRMGRLIGSISLTSRTLRHL